MSNKDNSKKFKFMASMLLSAVILLYVYTFLHESGHALIGIISGGKIEKMVLGLNARVRIVGADYNNITAPLGNIAGLLLPIIVFVIAIQLYNNRVKSLFYNCLFIGASLGVIGSSLAWIIVPIISIFSTPPAGDDVTKFLQNSSIDSIIVAAGAIVLSTSLVILVIKKGVLRKYVDIIKSLKEIDAYNKKCDL